MKKKTFVGFLAGIILSMTALGEPSHAIVHQDSYEIPLGQGMQLKKISQVYESGVQNINLVTVDLNNPNVKLDLIFNPNEISKRAKLSDMLKSEPNVVAAMNADFFSMANPSFSIGTMVKDGKQISTPHYQPNQFATVLVDDAQRASIEYIRSGVTIYNVNKGMTTVANSINKPNGATKGVIIYTSEYRSTTLGVKPTRPNLVEVIVQNGVVTDVRVAQPATVIPSDGYAIISDPASGRDLAQRFSVGDSVSLQTEITKNFPNTRMAVGGGSLLIKDGRPTSITKTVSGKSQRSALATTYDNKVIFMTVDGRGMGGAIGMSEKDVQSFLMAQNVKEAIVFDGGGSTEMIVDSKVENRINSERPIINAVAAKNIAQKSSPSRIEILPMRSILVQGQKVPLSVKVFDSNDNLIPGSGVSVSAGSLGGSFDGKNYTFANGGQGTLVASYGGASGSLDVEVIGRNDTDPKHRSALTSVSFAVATDTSAGSDDIMVQAMAEKLVKELEQVPNVILLGNSGREVGSGNTVSLSKGSVKTFGNTGFLLLDTSGDSLKYQWDALKNAVASDIGNLIIMTNSKVNLSGKSLELFQKIVHEGAKMKNIYIVEKRGSNSSYQEGSVSRISVRDIKNLSDGSLSDIKYLVFQEENGVLYYSFKSLAQ
ncbi:MAG: phosphodiester glycosidase family protein [Filifactor alocis]|nr:phosphodiester glycosidase family protein [Filifactor alocis]